MKIRHAKDYADMSRKAANIISAQVILKPCSVLGLATGSTPIGAYQQLIDWYKKEDVDFSEVITYNLGLDIDLFKNRFNFSFDIYRKDTHDMYVVGPELPAVYGNNPPKGNNQWLGAEHRLERQLRACRSSVQLSCQGCLVGCQEQDHEIHGTH